LNQITLNPGELLLGYTDGVIEAMNSKGTMIGADWLCTFPGDLNRPVGELHQRIVDEVHRFGGQENLYDDIALLSLKRV
jgi:sigma-B regulation protein RsbU (phosphoserine phosphatase)